MACRITRSMAFSSAEYRMLHLPPGDPRWSGLLAQFVLRVSVRDGRAYAAWAAERLGHSSEKNHALIVMHDEDLAGIMLFEILRGYAELTFPWLPEPSETIVNQLIHATVRQVQRVCPDVAGYRIERHLLPGAAIDTAPLERAGFSCHTRLRMMLNLVTWAGDDSATPDGYRVVPWHVRYLDRAAETIFHANAGTLDAVLYAPFFGDSPVRCRVGLLGILAGQYGQLHPTASRCVLHANDVVGVNLLLRESAELASVVEISVNPAHQGKGLGRLLMERSLNVLRAEGMAQVELAVTAANTRAVRLYQSLGFVEGEPFCVCVQ